jgi:ketosteroid isomerase-like protein
MWNRETRRIADSIEASYAARALMASTGRSEDSMTVRARALLWIALGVAIAFLIWPLLSGSVTPVAANTSGLDSLVASERAFSALSVEKGMRDAFLAYLADDAVIFRPLPMNGRTSWESRGPVPGTLIWEPSFAEVSVDKDLGYTTGPWEYRPPADSTGKVSPDAIAYGHFVSVWQRQPKGPWKVVIDLGCSHGKPELGVGSGVFFPGPQHVFPRVKQKFNIQFDLRTIEQGCWSERHAADSTALLSCAAPDIRYYRDGAEPTVGLQGVRATHAGRVGRARWLSQGGRSAKSDDLGYTYGIIERAGRGGAPPDSEVFLHIWRKNQKGAWQIALAVENPLKR